MISMDNRMRSDSDEDTELEGRSEEERLDHRAPIRADILGSIAGANPNSAGYLGKIDQMITAHGAMEMLPKPTMRAASDVATGGNESGNPTGIPLPAGRMIPPSAPDASRGDTAQPRMHPPTPTMAVPGGDPGMTSGVAPSLTATPDSAPPLMGVPKRPGLLGKIGHVVTRMGDIAGTALAPGVMMNIPGTMLNKRLESNLALMREEKQTGLAERRQRMDAAAAQAEFNTPEKRRAYMTAHPDEFEGASDFEKNDFVLAGKFPQREPAPKTERPENLDREAYDYYVGQGMSPADARKRVLQDAQSVKPERQTHTSPFEAFAYGTPEEKKAAQDFLSFEKRMGAQYQRPTEAEFRYSLYQRDPEGYKAVFGDKEAAADFTRAEHTAKLKAFFDKQRDAISKDFMLGDDEKAQQLRDLDEAERQFREATGGAGGPSGGDRVNVIDPNGQPGTIPRSQLKKAKKQGYREAGSQ